MAKLKRLARHLPEAPVGRLIYGSAEVDMHRIQVVLDSDWAGCRSTM